MLQLHYVYMFASSELTSELTSLFTLYLRSAYLVRPSRVIPLNLTHANKAARAYVMTDDKLDDSTVDVLSL